ncbi:hypothetical protein HG438_000005 [Candidatus Saccharibacteria bacterium]|nr:hypothetical protein [Candidatus Saccharibacteria bacterium]
MKSFFVHIVEFLALFAAGIAASQLIKGGHPALWVSILVIYAGIMLMRLWFSRVDLSINKTQKELLEGRLTTVTAQMRRLELALVEASVETLWVSSVTEDDDETVYVIETPNHGCFVIMTPADNATKNDKDAPAAPNKG